MTRFAGDFSGPCEVCGEPVEFAIGFRPGTDPLALHFGPHGPQPVELRDFALDLMVDETCDVRFRYVCPLCGAAARGKATCKATASMSDPLE